MGLLSQILGGLAGGSPPTGGALGGGYPPGAQPGGLGGGGLLRGGGLAGGGRTAVLMSLLPVVLRMLQQRQQGTGGTGSAAGFGGYGGGLDGSAGGTGGGASGFPGGASAGLGGALGGLGGLGGLMGRLSQRGHGDAASSWVSSGPNQPMSRGMVDDSFDDHEIAEIAREAGVGEDEARDGLSALLPEVVDHLTPDGQVPPADQFHEGIDALMRRMQAS